MVRSALLCSVIFALSACQSAILSLAPPPAQTEVQVQNNRFEKTVDTTFERYLPSKNHNPGGVWLPEGPYAAGKTWGLYFAPGTPVRDIVIFNANLARQFYPVVRDRLGEWNGNWEKTRAAMIPLAAKSTAGLILLFLQDTGALKQTQRP